MLWIGASRLSGQALDQLFGITLARLLTPTDFGIFALAAAFTSLFRVFMEMGLGRAIVQRATVDDEYLSTAFWASLVAGVLLFTLSLIVGGVIALISGVPMVATVVAVLATRFIFTAGSSIHMSVLSRRMEFRSIAGRGLAGAAVGGVVGTGIALIGGGVWSLVGQTVAMSAAQTALLWWAVPWRPSFVFSWTKFRDLWSFGGRLLASRLLNYLTTNMDNVLVGRFLGATSLGYYAMAYKMLLFPLSDVAVIVNNVVFSALSRLRENSKNLRDGFLQATGLVTLVLLPMMVGLAVVAPWFLEVVFGAKWLPATAVVRILAVAGAAQAVVSVWSPVIQAAGRADLQLRWSMVAVGTYLPAFAIGLRWGIVGVAAAYLVVTVVLLPLQLRYLGQIVQLRAADVISALRPGFLGVTVMLVALLPLARAMAISAMLPSWIELLILVTGGGVVYGAVVWLVARRQLLSLIRTMSMRPAPQGT